MGGASLGGGRGLEAASVTCPTRLCRRAVMNIYNRLPVQPPPRLPLLTGSGRPVGSERAATGNMAAATASPQEPAGRAGLALGRPPRSAPRSGERPGSPWELVRPSVTELSRAVRSNILCTVPGCGKVLPNPPALSMHLSKAHRVQQVSPRPPRPFSPGGSAPRLSPAIVT